MAEVQSRPAAPRGRASSHRSGRGSHNPRGGSRSAPRHSSTLDVSDTPSSVPLDEQGELGQLKIQYRSELSTLNELFPDWTDDDLVFGLQEHEGDLQTTIERITEGNVSRFADVKKKTREKSRPKQPERSSFDNEIKPVSSRGRGRSGLESTRGTRGRASDRGRGGARGGRGGAGASINGTRSTPTPALSTVTPSGGWDDTPTGSAGDWETSASGPDQWGSTIDTAESKPTPAEEPKSSIIPKGTTKSWASMLAKPKPPPAVPKAVPPASTAVESTNLANEGTVPDQELPSDEVTTDATQAPIADQVSAQDPGEWADDRTGAPFGASTEPSVDIIPPKDSLTEDNVENLPDTSLPASTDTVASTRDPRSAVGSVVPSFAATPQTQHPQQPAISRPPAGGYATSAWKATGTPGRSASFQKRMMAQQDPVVMPGNHAVDRAAVQFGSMKLGSDEAASKPLDVDEDREEAETRTQPPQQSPSQPRASLPPGPRPPGFGPEPTNQDLAPTPKQSQGFAAAPSQQSQSNAPQHPQHGLPNPPNLAQAGHGNPQYGQFNRYGAGSMGQETAQPIQKPYDPFSQQLSYPQGQSEQLGMNQGQAQSTTQGSQHAPTNQSGTTQAQSDFGNQYSTDQSRNAYQSYYGSSYGPTGGSNLQENVAPNRSTSGFGADDSAYGSGQLSQTHSRFNEAHASGNNTPSLPLGSHNQQSHNPSHHQHHGQGSQGGNYSYGNPYYGGSYYQSYMNQFPNHYGYANQGYGGPYGGKGNMYGQQPSHGFGMSPQASYEQSSSPANTGALGASSIGGGRDSALGGLGSEYSRSGSAQPHQATSNNNPSGFGSMGDAFGRSAGGFGGHQSYGQQTSGTNDESLKALHESKSGPSPGLGGQPGRPSSGFNTGGHPTGQSGYGPPQGSFGGGYPSHMSHLQNNPSSPYGGLGGLGNQHSSTQGHQGGGYGNYGGFGNSYGNYGGGRGWGSNYQH